MNIWLNIPAADYEGHMAEVGQQQLLNNIFRKYYRRFLPADLTILGCTTGNGLEHISTATNKITAIDINPEFLSILKIRFPDLNQLNTICADIEKISLPGFKTDLIFAGLIFEYVDVEKTIQNISGWINKQTHLVTVLQLPDENLPAVTQTNYRNLAQLGNLMRLHSAEEFNRILENCGLHLKESSEEMTTAGKRFYVALHTTNTTTNT